LPDDLRPLPRLPLDTAVLTGYVSSGLEAVLVSDAEGTVAQVSLMQTRTPRYYAPSYYAAIYDKRILAVQPTVGDHQSVIDFIFSRWSGNRPVPPQFPGESI
jgi:hypothetical protein